MAKVQGQYIVEVKGTGDAEATIKRVAEAQKSVAANTDRVVTGLNRADGKAKKLGESFAGVGLKVAGITAALYAAGRAAGAVIDAIEEGARARALNDLILNIQDGTQKVEAFRKGLRGALDTTTIQGFVRLGDQVGLTAKQLELASAYALVYSQTMGKELVPTIERVMQALATGSSESFKSLGLQAKTTEELFVKMAEIVEQSANAIDSSMQTHIASIKADYANMISDLNELIAESAVLLFRGEKAFAAMYSPQIVGVTAQLNKQIDEINEAILRQQRIIETHAATGFFPARLEQEKLRLDVLREQERALWRQVEAQRRGYEEAQRLAELQGVIRDDTSFPDPNRPASPRTRSRRGGGGRRASGGVDETLAALTQIRAREASEQAQYYVDLAAQELEREMMGAGGAANVGGRQQNGPRSGLENIQKMAMSTDEVLARLGTSMTEFTNASANMWAAIGDKTGSKKAIAVMQGFQRAQMAILAIVAGVKSVYEFAEMAASAARGDVIASVLHGVAGAQYAAVAGMNVTGAIMGAGGGGRGAASARSSFVPQDMRRQDSDGGGQITIIVGGDLVAGDEAAGSWTARALSAYAGRGGVLDPRLLRARGLGR